MFIKFAPTCRLSLAVLVLLVASSLTTGGAPLNDTLSLAIDGKQECLKHTGWNQDHLDDFRVYNDGCALVCIVKGKDASYNIRQGMPCYAQDYHCYDGSCYEKGHEPKDKANQGEKLYAIIKIHGASLRDADPWPLQGGSDPFAIVEELNDSPSGSEPPSKLFCHTKTIQDSNTPKWNHVCRSNPLSLKTRLRFSVYDSDKPAERPDKLGSVTIKLGDIADGEPHALQLAGSTGAGTTGSYLKVSISFEKNERTRKEADEESPIN